MAHFAKVNSENTVEQVITIPDSEESNGQAFINNSLGLDGRWIQCSYNESIRDVFPSAGYLYIESLDIFVEPAPKPWFILDDNGYWVCPIGLTPETGEPLTERQWHFLAVVYAIKPTFPTDLGPWTPRNEKQYEEGLQRANLSN